MTAIDLLPEMDELNPATAEKWVAAAAAEAVALRAFDAYLYPTTDDPADLARSHRLHDAWKRWIDEAGDLIDRLKQSDPNGRRHVLGLHDLRFAHATARGIVAMEPEEMYRSYRQVLAGEVVPIEEVRRELRARHGARHAV